MKRRAIVLTMLAACGGGNVSMDADTDRDATVDAPVSDGMPLVDARPIPDAVPVPDADLGILGPTTIGNYLEAAVCTWWVRCGLMPSGSTCEAAFDPALGQIPQLIAYHAAGRLTFDLTAAMTCLDDTGAQSCSWFDATPPASCAGVFTGSVAEGGDCIVNEECLGEAVCVQPVCEAECCTGLCTSPPAPAAVGAACGGDVPCEPAAWCDADICAARAAVGDACASVDGCAAGAYCSLDFVTGVGLCAALVDEGDACDASVAWPSGGCRRFDDWCNPATGVCERRLAAGASCAAAPTDRCLPYAACVSGTCVERPGYGDVCAAGTACLGELVCTGAHCVFPDSAVVCP